MPENRSASAGKACRQGARGTQAELHLAISLGSQGLQSPSGRLLKPLLGYLSYTANCKGNSGKYPQLKVDKQPMFALDTLTQLYLACTVFGWGFIIVSFFMGGFAEHGDSTDPGHLHLHQHGDCGHSHGGHAQITSTVAGHGNAAMDGQGHAAAHGSSHGHNEMEDLKSTGNTVVASVKTSTYFQILGILNPTSISVFTGFVGLTGLVLMKCLPFLGLVTLVPAILVGLVAVIVMRNVFAYLTAKLNVSNTVKSSDAIGHVAEVSASIGEGGTGEVTYVIGTTRFNAAAKSASTSETIKRGSKVLIVEREGHLVYVEPYQES